MLFLQRYVYMTCLIFECIHHVKCYQYWPNEKKAITCRNLRVSTDAENVFPVFVLRKIKVTDTKVNKQLYKIYTSWIYNRCICSFIVIYSFSSYIKCLYCCRKLIFVVKTNDHHCIFYTAFYTLHITCPHITCMPHFGL